MFARIDHRGFTIEPLDEDTACTPTSVAAHMPYETVNPYTMREPGGTIEVAGARPITQGSLHDQDMHAGQHHVPLANIVYP